MRSFENIDVLDLYMDTFFFVQSLLVTSAIIIKILKFVKKRKKSIFSNCKTQKLVFCVSMK